MKKLQRFACAWAVVVAAMLFVVGAFAEKTPNELATGTSGARAPGIGKAQRAAQLPDPAGLKRLDPRFPAWIDPAHKRIVMLGRVCLREGQLEMFACLKNTKEHESVVAIEAEAADVHAALMALGAEAQNPARFVPKYQ